VEHTKHNLSYNHADLDYEALVRTAAVAFGYVRNELSRCIGETHSFDKPISYASIAQRIKHHADHLAVVGETLYVLEQGKTREEIAIVHKGVVSDEE